MASVVLLVIYSALNVLAVWMTDLRMRSWFDGSTKWRSALWVRKYWLIPYILLALLPVAGAFLPDGPVKFGLQAAGNIWLGFYIYYGALLGLLILLARGARQLDKRREARRTYRGLLRLSLILSLAIVAYGLVHAQNTVVTRMSLDVDKPGEDLRLVLLADLHLGVNSHLETTQRMVELVNAESPDVVVVAGDIFTSSYRGLAHPEAYAAALRGIRSKYGVYAVYGNHDVEETLFGGFPISPISQAFRSREMEQFFDDCGFITLADEVVELDGIQLAGRLDGEKAGDGTTNRMSAAELLANTDKTRPILVLQHEPKGFADLKAAGADAALCGHTHAGQIFPGNLIILLFNENAWGYKRVHDLDTFVTSGVGYYGPPMRVGTDSEIMVIDFHFNGERKQ